jgi:Matrixin
MVMFGIRRLVVLTGTAALLLALAAPAAGLSAASAASVDELRIGAHSTSAVRVSPPPCQDSKYRLLGGKWTKAYQWSFKASSTPSSLSKAAVTAILQKSFSNITNVNNDCGHGDNVSATHLYLGSTSRSPNCNARDGNNVIGFASSVPGVGRLPRGVLAVTCYWIRSGKIVEADMAINSRESWALALAGCHGNMIMLEATITHEAGHVFGLEHVGERRHGRLTMSPYIDGPCENGEATLGRGDYLGLEKLY